MPAQLRLNLERAPDYARSAFVISTSNAAAASALDSWPDWRGGAMALVGPPGSGKTHLASIWAERLGAVRWPASDPARPVLIEDAEATVAEETLFHLINRAGEAGRSLLLTSRLTPGAWSVRLPDLRSRLNALPVAQLEPPDDVVLDAMLRSFFQARNIRPSPDLLAYLVRRIERSGGGALDVVARLDEASHAAHPGVSRSLARLVLGEDADAEDVPV